MVAGWILHDNLKPFLTTIGWVVGRSFNDDDLQSITTDLLDGGGGSYQFDCNPSTTLSIAISRDTNALNITVAGPVEFDLQLELAFAIFQNFRLRKRG